MAPQLLSSYGRMADVRVVIDSAHLRGLILSLLGGRIWGREWVLAGIGLRREKGALLWNPKLWNPKGQQNLRLAAHVLKERALMYLMCVCIVCVCVCYIHLALFLMPRVGPFFVGSFLISPSICHRVRVSCLSVFIGLNTGRRGCPFYYRYFHLDSAT